MSRNPSDPNLLSMYKTVVLIYIFENETMIHFFSEFIDENKIQKSILMTFDQCIASLLNYKINNNIQKFY